jgi:hypothetical protein
MENLIRELEQALRRFFCDAHSRSLKRRGVRSTP